MIELSDKSFPLNSTTIYPKCDHTLYSVLITKTKRPYWDHLCLEHFLFFSFFFSKSRSLITIITCPQTSLWTSSCSTTWIGPSYLVTHLDARISPNRFHQLSKTKLGLSEPSRDSCHAEPMGCTGPSWIQLPSDASRVHAATIQLGVARERTAPIAHAICFPMLGLAWHGHTSLSYLGWRKDFSCHIGATRALFIGLCLDHLQILSFFTLSITLIFGYMYEALNIGKKNN